MSQRVRVYRQKQRTKREETALWAVEEALRAARLHGTPNERSRALTDAVEALLGAIEETLR